MRSSSRVVLLVVCLAAAALCVASAGGVPKPSLLTRIATKLSSLPVIPEFNQTQYIGQDPPPLSGSRLYQAWSDEVVMGTFEKGGVCIFADYGLLPNGSISVYNEMRIGTPDGPFNNITGHATPDGSGVLGHLSVTLGAKAFAAPYWIIALGPVFNGKYEYSIVTDFLQATMWVLVRDLDRYFSLYDDQVQSQLQELGFTKFWNKPLLTNQTGCTYGVGDSDGAQTQPTDDELDQEEGLLDL